MAKIATLNVMTESSSTGTLYRQKSKESHQSLTEVPRALCLINCDSYYNHEFRFWLALLQSCFFEAKHFVGLSCVVKSARVKLKKEVQNKSTKNYAFGVDMPEKR